MESKLFRVNFKDIGRGLLVAVFTAILVKVAAVVNVPGFQFASFDFTSLIGVAVSAMVGYLTKNFLTDSSGTVLGKADR